MILRIEHLNLRNLKIKIVRKIFK